LEVCRENLRQVIWRLCELCELNIAYVPASYEPVKGDDLMVKPVGEGWSHILPRGGVANCKAARERALLARLNERLEEE